MSGKTQSGAVRVGVFDQIVSGGGVRLFTAKLLEEFSRLAGREWNFHLMYPLYDSSNQFLPAPALANVSFERINVGEQSRFRDRIAPALNKSTRNRLLPKSTRARLQLREQKIREAELRALRSGQGEGLRWLDERSDEFTCACIIVTNID